MEQAKKIFTRMLVNNWGGMDHQMITFHEHVNLFSGKSGSGKSTVMDAMQVVLYGSVRNDFLNRAADDTKNKRSVLSYLRGAQKDGTANRENQDFCAQIVLELYDTAKKSHTCVGVTFEVGSSDLELKKYCYFSHSGTMPEDEYLTKEGIPYSIRKMKQLIKERGNSSENKGRININRTYPSQEAYLNTLNETIFGYVDPGRFKTMEKSAIALRMTNGTGQFIKDYMFPKSKEDTISALSDQLAAYREIKERVETLEKEITLLDEVRLHDRAMVAAQADQIRIESLLKILDVEERKDFLAKKREDLDAILQKMAVLEQKNLQWKAALEEKREVLTKVQAELKSSELESKKEKLKNVNALIESCSNAVTDWRALVKRLKQWDETEGINDYVSNPTLNLLEEIWSGNFTAEKVEKIKNVIKDAYDSIQEQLEEFRADKRQVEKEYKSKKEILEDLKRDKKHYSKALKEVRRSLQEELTARYGTRISVEVLADLFDITDDEWRNAVEGRMGRTKFALVVEPAYAVEAAKIFRQMKKQEYETVDLIDTAAIQRDQPEAEPGTLYDVVKTEKDYVDLCLKRYLGRIKLCDNVEELHQVRDGVTKDCYSYSNYMFRHLRKKDYQYQSIGKKIAPKQIELLEKEVYRFQEQLIGLEQEIHTLTPVNDFERLQTYDYEKMSRLSGAMDQMKEYNREADALEKEIRELEQGTLMMQLKEQERLLKEEIHSMEEEKEKLQKELLQKSGTKGILKKDIADRTEALNKILEGFVPNEALEEEVKRVIETRETAKYKRENGDLLETLKATEERESELRVDARMKFIREFPSYDFGAMEKENKVYDDLLDYCRNNFEPKYKEEFEKQYNLVYQMLRENVIATIHSEIKAAKRHRREINDMLAKIRFSDSIYQIDILPTEDENRQFYEMLTAEELDMKVIDTTMDGQLSFGEDEFYQKYETQIKRLTDKFMPPKDEDPTARANHKRNMEKYADYRTYLKFSMYEKVEDEQGHIKKNYVDDMAGRDSGGEGQNPKYVALLAGFAMLYKQQSNRDSKIQLVLLDEAFSKMDKERSEVCLHYARKLGLQLIVCVPDERLQSLIRNVDCVYAFRRFQNRISMIHVDKGDYFKMLEGTHL